jgi:hypothetical protein
MTLRWAVHLLSSIATTAESDAMFFDTRHAMVCTLQLLPLSSLSAAEAASKKPRIRRGIIIVTRVGVLSADTQGTDDCDTVVLDSAPMALPKGVRNVIYPSWADYFNGLG